MFTAQESRTNNQSVMCDLPCLHLTAAVIGLSKERSSVFLLFPKLTVIIPFGVGHLLVFTTRSDPFSVCMYGGSSKWYSYNIISHQEQR